MKQIKVLGVFAIALALGLTACGGSKGSKSEQKSETPSSVASSEAPAESSAAPADSSEAPVESSSIAPCSKHTWGDYVETTPATCTVDGVQTRTCSVCGATQTKAIKAAHTWGEYVETKPATCSEEGKQERECSVCHEKEEKPISKLAHTLSEIAPEADTDVPEGGQKAKAATCTEAGVKVEKCSVCGARVETPIAALDHDYAKATDQTGAIAPTCTEAGTEIQECSRCHDKKSVKVNALGHDFPETGTELDIPGPEEKNTKGEIPFHWARITNYSCTRGDSYRYAWSAKEVNFDYESEGVHWTQEEISAAQSGDPAYGKSTSDWKSEPNLLDDGDGVRFFGRPINNAMPLKSDGEAADRGNTPKIPDPTIKGSRFEFDFVFDADVNDLCLSAQFTPAQYCNDVFRNGDNTEDWTPGYKNVELDPTTGVHWTQEEIDAAQEGDPAYGKTVDEWKTEPTYKGEIIKPFRFIILLDGEEVELDKNVSTPANGKGWYQFPCKLNLTAGKHNLNIAMAGGYRHVFYQFAFEKVAPAHEHKFGTGTAQEDEAQSKIYECPCEAQKIEWDANNFNAAASQVGNTAASNGGSEGITLSGDGYNKTANSDPSVGDHAVYNVNVPAAQAKAELQFTINRKDATEVFSGKGRSDNTKCYTLDPETGKTTSTQASWRYKLLVNDVEVEFTAFTSENPEPKTVANTEGTYTFPCEFALKAGVNKIELQKWGGYAPVIVSLALVYGAD